MRTLKEQQEAKRAFRREWLQELADTGESLSVCARMAGCRLNTLCDSAKSHGVAFVEPKNGPITPLEQMKRDAEIANKRMRALK